MSSIDSQLARVARRDLRKALVAEHVPGDQARALVRGMAPLQVAKVRIALVVLKRKREAAASGVAR
jgi:hypothetical protein